MYVRINTIENRYIKKKAPSYATALYPCFSNVHFKAKSYLTSLSIALAEGGADAQGFLDGIHRIDLEVSLGLVALG